ncbi:hypothetical protein ANAPC5_00973 [Anaplasma phagocytophilum]|nr:hypothetical protein ANAPC2_01052 [Anaplasma phagocytophilum]SBO33265.1 hypothetical protein ANAPC3_01158 [Anaplasma phagocytophilum]SBO33311.1 hypothetical protein ANAPC4_01109 [Anaplasma phagocytophilum]SCV64826.1 hypothetical protein ANAPC5_00973 [Anaplasma phagocytophilum]
MVNQGLRCSYNHIKCRYILHLYKSMSMTSLSKALWINVFAFINVYEAMHTLGRICLNNL